MTFALPNPTKAKIEDVGVLSQKNRPIDANPGVQLSLSMRLSNHILTTLDPLLKPFLFAPKDGAERRVTRRKDNVTDDLDGVEPVTDLPALSTAGTHIKGLVWSQQVTGGEAEIIFATSRIPLSDCTATSFRIHPQDGGTVLLKFILEAPDASAKVFGDLAMFKSREVELTFVQHEPAQMDIEPPAKPNKAAKPPKTPVIDGTKGHPGAAATPPAGKTAQDEFIERNTGAPAPVH